MRDKIKMVSSAGTGNYYTTTKNKCLHPDKMETRGQRSTYWCPLASAERSGVPGAIWSRSVVRFYERRVTGN